MWRVKNTLKNIIQKGLLHILMGSFLSKVVSFFGSIFLVRILSKEHYGILSYLENIYGYLLTLAGMGVSNAILRYVILGKNRQEKYSLYLYARNRGIICNCILLFAGICFNWFYPHPEEYKEYTWLLYVLLITLPFQYITDNVLSNERAQFSNQRYAALSFFLTISIILTKVIFGRTGGISWIVFGQTLAYIVLSIIFSVSTREKYYKDIEPDILPSNKKAEINFYSVQYMITNGLWSAFMLNDTFLIGRYCSPEVLAEYKVAYTIPGSVSLLSTSIGIFIAPYFVRNEKNRDWIQKNFKRVYAATGMLVGGICAAIFIFRESIIYILYGEQYLGVSRVMRVLLVATFFNCGLRYTTANILAAMGRIKYNMLISVAGMFLQVLINICVIPYYGSVGAAFTSCFVYAIMAISLLWIFIYQYYIKGN